MTKVKCKSAKIGEKLNRPNVKRKMKQKIEQDAALIKNPDHVPLNKDLSETVDTQNLVQCTENKYDLKSIDFKNLDDIRSKPQQFSLGRWRRKSLDPRTKSMMRIKQEIKDLKVFVPEPTSSLLGVRFNEQYQTPFYTDFVQSRTNTVHD